VPAVTASIDETDFSDAPERTRTRQSTSGERARAMLAARKIQRSAYGFNFTGTTRTIAVFFSPAMKTPAP